MIGIKSPSSFRGKSITSKDFDRHYVMYESQGRGPCHLEYKPIRICVRSKFKKIIYEFKQYKKESGKIIEAYDLHLDPNELANLYKDKIFIKKCLNLTEVAKNRIKEILN
jgi:hypothetical protein